MYSMPINYKSLVVFRKTNRLYFAFGHALLCDIILKSSYRIFCLKIEELRHGFLIDGHTGGVGGQ